MYIIIVFLSGTCLAIMQSFNGILGQYIPLSTTTLITHVIGGLCLYLILKIKKIKLKLGPMPLYCYLAGFLGYSLVFLTSATIVEIGATLVTCFSIAGQVFASVIIDHFDLFKIKRVPFKPVRIISLSIIMVGLIIANIF